MIRVGFIGLGSQGGPMARRIVESGFPLTLWARRQSSLDPFAATAMNVAATPAEVGGASDLVGICVVADADVEDVLLRADGVLAGMSPGGIISIHSTIHPDTCRRLAVEAGRRGISIVDAPVSGGGRAAAERRLLVMVGGADADVERCRPVFEAYGDPIVHTGPLGSAQVAKLLNNFVFTAQIALALDTFEFADQLGVDRTALSKVLTSGSGGSRVVGILAATGFNLTGLRDAVSLLRKDLDITREVARARGVIEPPSIVRLAETALGALSRPT
jgi:3-hydroxyisobutyrate dehydrogenase-like beta-hydroxyacid dehydrogenase